MPIATSTKLLGINDAKISKLTVDDAASLTYATAIDVPGIRQLQLSPTFVEKDLRGDEKVMDRYTRLDTINFSWENAKLSLDALAVLLGGTVTSGGTTPNQTQTFSLKGADVPNYFKIEAQTKYADVGDVHVILYKCKASNVEYTLQGEEYAVVSVSGTAIPTVKDDKIKEIKFNETATDIV